MKNIATLALFIVAAFFATGSAPAQDHKVQATVPFSFTVGNRTMPAGTYTISSNIDSPHLLTIANREKGAQIFAMGQPDQENREQVSKLVFHKYGDQYFLSEVRTAGSSLNVNLSTSKAEKTAKSQIEAANLRVNDPVMVALK